MGCSNLTLQNQFLNYVYEGFILVKKLTHIRIKQRSFAH